MLSSAQTLYSAHSHAGLSFPSPPLHLSDLLQWTRSTALAKQSHFPHPPKVAAALVLTVTKFRQVHDVEERGLRETCLICSFITQWEFKKWVSDTFYFDSWHSLTLVLSWKEILILMLVKFRYKFWIFGNVGLVWLILVTSVTSGPFEWKDSWTLIIEHSEIQPET